MRTDGDGEDHRRHRGHHDDAQRAVGGTPQPRWVERPAVKLGGFVVLLGAVLGLGALAGATFGPEPSRDGVPPSTAVDHAGDDHGHEG